MMCPASSSTMKSRTFSQISAKVRGNSVPSPEYEEIRSWMRSASGRKASRVCMGLLAQRPGFLAGGCDCMGDAWRGGPAGDVVDCQHVLELHEIVEVGVEVSVDALQLFEREILQLAVLVERGANRLSNLFMGDAERHAFADKIRRGGERVHVSGVRSLLHALESEFDGFHPSGDQRQ